MPNAATAEHAGTVERMAPHGLDVMVEKPFAANAHEARRMVAALDRAGGRLAINWPLAWSPALNTAKRLVEEGAVGALIELHYYGGNRGYIGWEVIGYPGVRTSVTADDQRLGVVPPPLRRSAYDSDMFTKATARLDPRGPHHGDPA